MSSYRWSDYFFSTEESKAEIRAEMSECLEGLGGKLQEFAVYRFGLEGQDVHSRQETAERFLISADHVRYKESSVLRAMGMRMPTIRSRKEYVD